MSIIFELGQMDEQTNLSNKENLLKKNITC